MDRFSIVIERQEQIEEMTPPDLFLGDDFLQGPWSWKGPIFANWKSAYGKFFKGKAGFVNFEKHKTMKMQPFVMTLACGGENFCDGWMKNPKSAMISCYDGFRPVSFYIETMED